ncbi:MAG: hypothetical protein IJQ98_07035 [Oscillospiraceae bacterium]|nr:hypothetical protein [Oscillospiraceae bacterium]
MASTKDYLNYVLEQLSGLADVDDAESLRAVLTAMVDELPETKKKEGTAGKSSCTKWKRNRC